jgi:hypothetical protein
MDSVIARHLSWCRGNPSFFFNLSALIMWGVGKETGLLRFARNDRVVDCFGMHKCTLAMTKYGLCHCEAPFLVPWQSIFFFTKCLNNVGWVRKLDCFVCVAHRLAMTGWVDCFASLAMTIWADCHTAKALAMTGWVDCLASLAMTIWADCHTAKALAMTGWWINSLLLPYLDEYYLFQYTLL